MIEPPKWQKKEQISSILEGKVLVQVIIGFMDNMVGADQISADDELARVVPVIKEVKKRLPNILLSIDTFYSRVAAEAVKLGVHVVNDVSGGAMDPEMFTTCAKLGVPLVVMHTRGTPKTMSSLAQYKHVMEEVGHELNEKITAGLKAKMYRWHIIADPGLGFAKKPQHSLEVIQKLDQVVAMGYPVLVGPSRKGFIGKVTGEADDAKLMGTAAACYACIQRGASIVRVHDVKEMKCVISMADVLRQDLSSLSFA